MTMLTINELSLFLNPLDSSTTESHAETTPTTNTYRISSSNGGDLNDLSSSFDYDLNYTNEFTSQRPTSSTTISITNVSSEQLYFSADFSSSTFNLQNNSSSDNFDIDVLESATTMAVQTYERIHCFDTEHELFDLNSSKSPSKI